MAERRAEACKCKYRFDPRIQLAEFHTAQDFLHDFIQVNIGSTELTANHSIRQIIEVCTDFEKRNKLIQHLERISTENAKVLIFVGTKRVADDITKYLRQDGWPALAIHGDKEQRERDWVLAEFKAGRSPILIATDVASRGLGMYLIRFIKLLVRESRTVATLKRFPQ